MERGRGRGRGKGGMDTRGGENDGVRGETLGALDKASGVALLLLVNPAKETLLVAPLQSSSADTRMHPHLSLCLLLRLVADPALL